MLCGLRCDAWYRDVVGAGSGEEPGASTGQEDRKKRREEWEGREHTTGRSETLIGQGHTRLAVWSNRALAWREGVWAFVCTVMQQDLRHRRMS